MVSLPYYRKIRKYGQHKFKRLAVNVFGCDEGKDEETLSREAIDCIESFIDELGIPKTLRELGAAEDMLPKIADSVFPEDGGYKKLTRDEVLEILKECY